MIFTLYNLISPTNENWILENEKHLYGQITKSVINPQNYVITKSIFQISCDLNATGVYEEPPTLYYLTNNYRSWERGHRDGKVASSVYKLLTLTRTHFSCWLKQNTRSQQSKDAFSGTDSAF